jgi:hypothetical protein
MQSPLQRLYKTKFVLVAVLATVAGIALLLVGGWPSWRDTANLIGGSLATAGLIGVWFQYIGNADAENEAKRQFREAIREEAPAIRDSVVDAMAFTPEKLLDVTAPEVLDHVIENSLAKQLGDRTFAAEIYHDLKAQALRSKERWHDLRISAALVPWKSANETTPASVAMFVATFRYDYRVTNPAATMRFACVTDLDEYRELQADPDMTEVWYVQPKPGLDGASPDVFELVEVTVDGKRQKIRRTTKAGAQFYSVHLDTTEAHADEATISFTYRGLLQQHGHLLYIDLVKPTKGLSVNLTYGGSGIRYVSVADYIAAAKQPTISRRPADDPSPAVSLTFDGWVMPKGGVAFVWVLEGEIAHTNDQSPSPGIRQSAH